MITFDSDFEKIYLALVSLIAIVGALLIQLRLRREETSRSERIQNLQRFTATALPEYDEDILKPKKTRREALQSIATRYAMLRRVLVPGFLFICLIAASIPFLGRIPATFFTVLLGAVTVILGIVAKPVLENMASGIVFSISQPARIGDIVQIEGAYGIVEDIGLTHTTIKKWDWTRLVVPHAKLLQTPLTNFTAVDRLQWAYIEFFVSTDADLEVVRDIAMAVAREASHHMTQEEHEPGFWLIDQKQTAVRCWLAAWVEHPVHAWSLRTEMLTEVSKRLKQNRIASHGYRLVEESPLSHGQPTQGEKPT